MSIQSSEVLTKLFTYQVVGNLRESERNWTCAREEAETELRLYCLSRSFVSHNLLRCTRVMRLTRLITAPTTNCQAPPTIAATQSSLACCCRCKLRPERIFSNEGIVREAQNRNAVRQMTLSCYAAHQRYMSSPPKDLRERGFKRGVAFCPFVVEGDVMRAPRHSFVEMHQAIMSGHEQQDEIFRDSPQRDDPASLDRQCQCLGW